MPRKNILFRLPQFRDWAKFLSVAFSCFAIVSEVLQLLGKIIPKDSFLRSLTFELLGGAVAGVFGYILVKDYIHTRNDSFISSKIELNKKAKALENGSTEKR